MIVFNEDNDFTYEVEVNEIHYAEVLEEDYHDIVDNNVD